jgi:hypothetical protein
MRQKPSLHFPGRTKLAIDKSRQEELEKQGWTMRFTAGEPRLSEAIDQYKASGFEVLLESMSKDMSCTECAGEETVGQCRVCYEGYEDQYKLIFTRPCKHEKQEDEDLF